MSAHDSRGADGASPAVPVSTATALSALRQDATPSRDLWPEISARITARIAAPVERVDAADQADADAIELPAALGAALRELQQPVRAERDLWVGIAARLSDPAATDAIELPPVLAQALRGQRQDHAPPRDLWQGIEQRIQRRRDRRIRAPWISAAALAASLVLGLSLMLRQAPGVLPAPDAAGTTAAGTASARAPLRPSPEVLAATLANGSSDRDGQGELRRAAYRPMSSETRALMRANLKIVKNAETQLKRALADDPDDAAYLESLLDAAREQKGELRAALEQP